MEEVIPIVWHKGFILEKDMESNLQYSLIGKPGGPILLWIVNNGPSLTFEISLNSSFLQLNQNGWIAIDMVSLLPVTRGQNSLIFIDLQVKNSWVPIYIMNDINESHVIYSNYTLDSRSPIRRFVLLITLSFYGTETNCLFQNLYLSFTHLPHHHGQTRGCADG